MFFDAMYFYIYLMNALYFYCHFYRRYVFSDTIISLFVIYHYFISIVRFEFSISSQDSTIINIALLIEYLFSFPNLFCCSTLCDVLLLVVKKNKINFFNLIIYILWFYKQLNLYNQCYHCKSLSWPGVQVFIDFRLFFLLILTLNYM